MKENRAEIAREWLKANVSWEELNDSFHASFDDALDYFSLMMSSISQKFAPKSSMKKWINRNYKVGKFVECHSRQVQRYYNSCNRRTL